MKINGNTITSTTDLWQSGFSKNCISSGTISWKVKVCNGTSVMIGVIPKESIKNKGDKYFYYTTGAIGYYSSDGNKYIKGSASSYGASYGTNDIITVNLDMSLGELSFSKNNVDQGKVTEKIQKNSQYHLAIATSYKNYKLEVISMN